ncbi:MAG: hypothetical protein LUF82_07880 [Clostridia bacterium]|nr:hypothetical protein [Clostridia bacterium]
MKDFINIKLYRTSFWDEDYHDHILCILHDEYKAIAEYGESIGKIINFGIVDIFDEEENHNFAEVNYSGELSEEERDYCIKLIKRYNKNIIKGKGGWKPHRMALNVSFIKCEADFQVIEP